MADLRKFVWNGTHDGMKLDFYAGFPRVVIGDGEFNELKPLYLRITGTVRLHPRKETIEVIMPNENDRGACTLVISGARFENCPYHVEGNALIIKHPSAESKLEANDRKYTWVTISGTVRLSVGIWPKGQKMTAEDLSQDLV